MSEPDSVVPDTGMATGNDAPIGGGDALPLDEDETQLLNVLRRAPRAVAETDLSVLRAAREDTVVSLDPGGAQDDALTPVFTEP
ncbi:MAG: hypothetical protein QOF57_1056 [Frankiaceae bacterium]|jgi:hypothetical protein|nr:hypothetical protein [Frankiaceae bacterium]MDQ1726591.1 hypothetical protein [Frankiaceae bacterium]